MAGEVAPYLDGIPVVADAATREVRFPLTTRQQDQRCFNKGTGNVERWSGSAWVVDLTGVGGTQTEFNLLTFNTTGSTDWSTALANCLAAAAAVNGKAVLPPRATPYLISAGASLSGVTGLTIVGYGATLKLSGNAATDSAGRVLQFISPSNLTILGLGIDGNASVQTVTEQRTGIFVYQGTDIVIRDCSVTNTMGDNIEFYGDGVGSPCQRISVTGCTLTNSQRHNLCLVDVRGAVIANNDCDTAQQGNIHCEADTSTQYLKDIAITGNRCKNAGLRNTSVNDAAISVGGVLGATFAATFCSGNSITGNSCTDQGIAENGAWAPTITGNTIVSARGTGAADGIGIQTASPSASVTGNTVIAPGQTAIWLRYDGGSGSGTYGLSAPVCSGNTIRELPTSGTAYGILASSVVRGSIQGNTIVNTSISSSAVGIRLAGSASGTKGLNTVVANNVIHNQAYGITEDAYCLYTRYEGNEFGTLGTAKFSIPTANQASMSQAAKLIPVSSGVVATINYDAVDSKRQLIIATATSGTLPAITVNAPSHAYAGMEMTLYISNASGGTMGSVSFAAGYRTAGAFTVPANGKVRTITFDYDGTSWFERTRSSVDL